MGYIFSIIAFLILLPIVFKLKVGIKPSSKVFILSIAFLLSIFGVFAAPFIGTLKALVILILFSIILVFLFERMFSEDMEAVAVTSEGVRVKGKIIVLQDEEIVETNSPFVNVVETDVEDTSFLEQRQAVLEVKASTKEVAITTEEEIEQDSKSNGKLNIDTDNWLNDLSEPTVDEETYNKKDYFEELDPIDNSLYEIIEDKRNKK